MPEASRNVGRANSVILILENGADEWQSTGTPLRWRGTAMVAKPGTMGLASGRGSIGTPKKGRGNSSLPYWYPRKPLQDITAVMRAIERRKARREDGEGLQYSSPILQDRTVHDPSLSSGVSLKHDFSVISPNPGIGKVTKILLNITNQDDGDSITCLTPQKKLLDDIDKVEKVLMEELLKLKRTPTAKKAEREKRVRTLMSMR